MNTKLSLILDVWGDTYWSSQTEACEVLTQAIADGKVR